ncbi:unnamed protein product [Heligmosomoides polygyrus]|uniref:Fucosyltransferase n=1 Tax=Heligmosomoides polygyrus TaxID=6339 RepID=A0A3P7TCC5_HELPZ|nr:unnamed protein product [Heligmosomoides polygyrus]
MTGKPDKNSTISIEEVQASLKKKTRGALIFVSNCATPSKREQLIKQLGQYTELTVRGGCEARLSFGNKTRKFMCKADCSDDGLIATHRFYISFENSLCNDYITEKFFLRISQKLVPIVVKRQLYEAVHIPSDSFIALDDFKTVKELGDYMNYLRSNDTAYLKYFEWTKHYRNPAKYVGNSLCKLCEDIHMGEKMVIKDIVKYYKEGQCFSAPVT